MHLNLVHRGKHLAVSTDHVHTLGDLRTKVGTALSVPAENVRLLADGKLLPSTEDHTPVPQLLRPSQTVLVLATTPETIKNLKEAKPDTTLRPLDAKAPKFVAAPRKTPQRPRKYGFGSISVLSHLPDSDRARQILEQLASDRGFLAVMEKKRWYVGELREMPPEGRVGVDPVCVLGYNTNKGQQIHLRLRTDDMTGFRAMFAIRQVLAHELAHNEFSEHDNNFKELMRWIEKTAARDNWRALGSRLDDGWHAPEFNTTPSSWTDGGRTRGENKLGSESGSTGVSRLLTAYEKRSADADADAGGREDMYPVDLKRDAAEDGEQKMGSAQNEKGTDGSCCDTARKEQGVDGHEVSNRLTALDQVMCLGFSRELARLALRENDGDSSRAADWLLSERITREPNSEMGEMEAETRQRIEKAVNSLGGCVQGGELISVLDTLHMYMSNLIRHGDVEGYCRINSSNQGFQRRVGRYADAIQVLRVCGFRLQDGFWRYHSMEISRVWIAKSVIEEHLLQQLIK